MSRNDDRLLAKKQEDEDRTAGSSDWKKRWFVFMNADLKQWVDRYLKGHRISDGCLICRLVAEIEAQEKRIESLEATLIGESEARKEKTCEPEL
jgi:hypothetical protein